MKLNLGIYIWVADKCKFFKYWVNFEKYCFHVAPILCEPYLISLNCKVNILAIKHSALQISIDVFFFFLNKHLLDQ